MSYKKRSKNTIKYKNYLFLVLYSLVILFFFTFSIDLFLKKKFGLGNPILYYFHPNYGYALRPDQNIVRFGKKIKIDEFGSRSNYDSQKKTKIIFFGDSVVYGGRLVGNDNLLSELVCNNLKKMKSCLNFGTNAYGLENIIRRINHNTYKYRKDFAIIFFNFNNLKRGVSKISGQPFFNKPVDGIFKGVNELLLRYLDIKRLKYRYTNTNKLEWEKYDKYLYDEDGNMKKEILSYYQKVVNDLFYLINKEFDDYLVVINFSEKDRNEMNEIKMLKEMLSNYNKNKILYLKEQLKNENVKISKLFDDHIHYNEYGHKIVATFISNYLKKNYEKFN